MRSLLTVSTAIDWLNDKVGLVVCWLALVMVLIGALNALARYIGVYLGAMLSSNAYLEAQWYLFGAMFMLAAGYTLRRNEHVRVDVLYGGLSRHTRAVIDLVGSLAILVPFCVITIWLSLDWVAFSWQIGETSSNPGGLPRYPIKTVIPIAFVLLLLQAVSQAIKAGGVLTGHVASHTSTDSDRESSEP